MNAERPDAPVKPGEIIAGKYRVERVLGVGGMGFVVAATHLDLLELRALKFMLPSALPDVEAVERFLREARAASRLKSEHVARVFDVGRLADGSLYMVMEHLDGTDLGAALKRSGVPPVEEAVIYVVQALDALAEAHAAGIVHRDLKPANLFLTHRSDGTPCVKVLDFGISKIMGSTPGEFDVTKTHAVLGSPQYMSPEQMHSSRDVDARSDIWSLGVILYQLLTGNAPFRGRSLTELVASVMMAPIAPPSQLAPRVPRELDAVVLRCLERDVNARYPSVVGLALGLKPFALSSAGFLVDRIVRAASVARASAPALAPYTPDSQRSLAIPAAPSSNRTFSSAPTPMPSSSPLVVAGISAPTLAPQPPPLPPPSPALSNSGAWGGTAALAPSRPARSDRSRAAIIVASAAASALGAALALSVARGRTSSAASMAEASIGRAALAAALAAARTSSTSAGTGASAAPDVAASPSAQPAPSSTASVGPKKPARRSDPFGMDRK